MTATLIAPPFQIQSSTSDDTEKQAIVKRILNIIQASNADVDVLLSFGLSSKEYLTGRYRAGTQVFEYEISPNSISDTPVSKSRSDSYLRGYYSRLEPAIAIKTIAYLRGWLNRFDATTSSNTKKPQCTPGKSRLCGGACIPLKNKDGSDRNCRFDPSPEIKQEIQEVIKVVKKRQGKNQKNSASSPAEETKVSASSMPLSEEGVNLGSLTNLAKAIAPKNFVLHGLAQSIDEKSSLSEKAAKRVDALVSSYKDVPYGSKEEWTKFHESKVAAIKKINPDISDAEANGLALYINGDGYSLMNKVMRTEPRIKKNSNGDKIIVFDEVGQVPLDFGKNPEKYSDSYKEKYIEPVYRHAAASTAAAIALSKFPELSTEQIKKDNKDFEEGNPLKRHISIKEDELDKFLERYKPGQDVVETSFVSTTAIQKENSIFAKNSNVTFQINYKKTGSSGKYVDKVQRKLGEKEGEVIFPPLTKFRVKEVALGKGKKAKTVIVMEEI